MDIVAFHPERQELVHVEASMDADSWRERFARLKKKFRAAERHYSELFPFEHERVKKVAILGLTETHRADVPVDGVEIVPIPRFIRQLTDDLRHRNFLKEAVPEELPRLRAIQMAVYWSSQDGETQAQAR